MNPRLRIFRYGFLFLLAAAIAGTSLACAVCFGQSDAPVVKGMELSVLFMVLVTYGVIGGGVATAIILRRKQRRPKGPNGDP